LKLDALCRREASQGEDYESITWRLGTPRGEYVLKRRLGAVLPLVHGSRLVVDVGVGPATLSQHFGCEVVGCDISVSMLRQAKQRISEAVLADAECLPFRNKVFEIAFESGCLPYVRDRLQVVKEMARVSRERIITFESNRWSLRRLVAGKSSAHPSPLQLAAYHEKLGLQPSVQLVGFAPFVQLKLFFEAWPQIERVIERTPLIRYLCGGILVHSRL